MRPRKETNIRICGHCGRPLERKYRPSGRLESIEDFEKRKYCDRVCMAFGMSKQK
jgi:hypothetical protein